MGCVPTSLLAPARAAKIPRLKRVFDLDQDRQYRRQQRQRHRHVEQLQRACTAQVAPDAGAERGPGPGAGQGHDQRDQGDDRHLKVEVRALAGGVGGDRAHRHQPGLGIDPLERRGLQEGERLSRAAITHHRGAAPDLESQPQQIGATDDLHDGLQQRRGKQDRGQAQPHQQQHHGKADRYARQMGQAARQAKARAGGSQHHIIGPGRERHDGRKDQDGKSGFQRHGRELRAKPRI